MHTPIPEAKIETQNLKYTYPLFDDAEAEDPTEALKGITIKIPQGQCVAILGHNGCGKSTLARHFNALLTPTTGDVIINQTLNTKDPTNTWEIRRSTGMLFQNPDNQIVASIVEEDVAFGPENLGIPSAEITQRVHQALKTVNMLDYKDAQPHNLSGGQKQRVAIAGVLAMHPSTIVLDEPTAMLDPLGRREVLEAVIDLNKNSGMTVALITHFMEEAVLADWIIVMDAGQVITQGTPQQVFAQQDKMEGIGLGVPVVTTLATKLGITPAPISIQDFITCPQIQSIIHAITTPQHVTHPTIKKSETTAIQLKDLTHTYSPNTPFEKIAIHHINIQIQQGQLVAIIGHTGSGKSTLIQHLNGLIKPTSGQVLLNGHDIHQDKSKLKAIRQKVGLVFQYPEHQLFESTVYRDVAFGPSKMEDLSEAEIHTRVTEALAIVGIPQDLFEKSPFELSGGQKRRVAIAGILAMQPEVLVLDEPAAGLDPKGKEEILTKIKHMHQTLGITVIIISHSMDDVANLAEEIYVLNQGQLAHHGTPSEVFAKEAALKAIGLDIPQISQLFSVLHQQNPNIPKDVLTINTGLEILKNGILKGGVTHG